MCIRDRGCSGNLAGVDFQRGLFLGIMNGAGPQHFNPVDMAQALFQATAQQAQAAAQSSAAVDRLARVLEQSENQRTANQ
eukprot:1450045-Alexandrium_andersonii.AAC.1